MKHTFKDAYGVLQQHAQTLRDQTEPNTLIRELLIKNPLIPH